MKDLTITQEYLICAVNGKGRMSSLDSDKQVCFVAAGLLELQLGNCIKIENKKVTVTGELPTESVHLKPLYDFIDQPKPVKLDKIVEGYYGTFSDKRLKELTDSVGASLEAQGLAEAGKTGVFDNRRAYIPAKEAVTYVIEKMRSELLEEGTVSEDTAALAILLEKSKVLKTYFSDFERKEMKTRLKEILDSGNGKIVKDMIDYVENMTAVMVVLMGFIG